MSQVIINPRIRGFICTTSHPEGCAVNVRKQIAVATKAGPGTGLGNVLVVGSSGGYGLASTITALFGHGAKVLSVAFERPGSGEKAGSAGWYNLAEVHRQAQAQGKTIESIIGDAFSTGVLDQAIAALKDRFGPIDTFVYSLASPKRTDPATGATYSSVLKPIGPTYTSQTVDTDTDVVKPVTINPAVPEEIANTVKVMGGEDWERWVRALQGAGLLAKGFRTVAYSYIGPEITYAVYRKGTIGAAKDHLEATALKLNAELAASVGGGAWVSVNKALVTQASAAIPVVPLYTAILYKIMKANGTHEGTIEQIVRLFADHLAPGKTPAVDANGRIRVDDREMRPEIQAAVVDIWKTINTENLAAVSDYTGFKHEFRTLFGFEVAGVDYAQAVEIEHPLV